jgi:hypothetical protein
MTITLLLTLLLLLLLTKSKGFLRTSRSQLLVNFKQQSLKDKTITTIKCYADGDAPGDSDYGSTAVDDMTGSCGLDEKICQLKSDLIEACIQSNRGQMIEMRKDVSLIISSLIQEATMKKEIINALLIGHWELMYIDEDVTRASPFFWSFRKALKGIEDPFKIVGPKLLSESIFKITDDIPFKEIGSCKQDFTSNGEMISKIEVKISNLPFDSRSLMTTTSQWLTTKEEDIIELKVEKTQVLDSTIGEILKVSPLSFLTPEYPFPSGAALELVKSVSSTVYMKVLFIDEELRVCKNIQDDKLLIFKRI